MPEFIGNTALKCLGVFTYSVCSTVQYTYYYFNISCVLRACVVNNNYIYWCISWSTQNTRDMYAGKLAIRGNTYHCHFVCGPSSDMCAGHTKHYGYVCEETCNPSKLWLINLSTVHCLVCSRKTVCEVVS